MNKHAKQIAWFSDPHRHTFALAGRRGGKTTGLREKICKAISKMPPGSEIAYVGPTHQQAKELMWENLDDRMLRLKWHFKAIPSRQVFEFSKRRRLYIIGAEKIRRLRGKKLFRFFGDEVAFWTTPPQEVWRVVRPALSDLKGGSDWCTTPNGKGTPSYDFYLDAMSKDAWGIHTWSSIDNPGMDQEEIETAKSEMDEKSFRQEYLATWETFEGLAYYNFSENIHIKRQPPIDPADPLILHFDFNVNPTTLVLGQLEPDDDRMMYRFKREYSQKNSSTISTVRSFCEDYKHLRDSLRLKIRGDASGKNRSSNTGRADYEYIKEMLNEYGFQYEVQVMASNPAIVDRVSHVNSYLMNVKGQHRVEFDPSMTDTIRDLSSQVLDGRHPSDKNNLGHKADAIGYGIYWEYVNSKRKSSSTIIL